MLIAVSICAWSQERKRWLRQCRIPNDLVTPLQMRMQIDRFLHIRTMRCNRVMVAGVRTVTLKAECFRPTLRGRSKIGLSGIRKGFCVNDRLFFWWAAFHLYLSAAVGAVGTVGKRILFFHGFHSPIFCLAGSFINQLSA